MRKLKPLVPSVTQVNRVSSMPVGSGFVIFRMSEEAVQVAEFSVSLETGEMLSPNGDPFSYILETGGEEVVYQVTIKRSQRGRQNYERKPHAFDKCY